MNERLYKQFADSLLSLVPSFPMDATEIEMLVRTQGLKSFISVADEYDMGITEVVELLLHLGKGGDPHGPG